MVLLHSLGISVMPLSSDRVLLEQGGDPLLTLGLPFAGRLPLSFLQDEFLVGGLGLVLVVDGPGHVVPQSDGVRGNKVRRCTGVIQPAQKRTLNIYQDAKFGHRT